MFYTGPRWREENTQALKQNKKNNNNSSNRDSGRAEECLSGVACQLLLQSWLLDWRCNAVLFNAELFLHSPSGHWTALLSCWMKLNVLHPPLLSSPPPASSLRPWESLRENSLTSDRIMGDGTDKSRLIVIVRSEKKVYGTPSSSSVCLLPYLLDPISPYGKNPRAFPVISQNVPKLESGIERSV